MAATSATQARHPEPFEDESMALALQMEELHIFAERDKGKYRADKLPDVEVAIRSFCKELQNYKTYREDHKLAQSVGVAVHEDGPMIVALASQDSQAFDDRQIALRLSEEESDYSDMSHTIRADAQLVREYRSSVAGSVVADLLVESPDADEEEVAGPSMNFAERQADLLRKLSTMLTCSVCHEKVRPVTMVNLECEDQYCIDCAKGLFVRATHDETLFPPRCCKKPIALESVIRYMSAEELKAYEVASLEYTTIDRVYCSNLQCGKFLPPALINIGTKSATCDVCGARTCSLCKSVHHEESDCPQDPALHETRQLAFANGWQTCPGCNMLVQLRTGCNHITCRCRAEFCYICGVRWKNCKCDTADEHRMLERAEEVVDRDAEVELLPAERNLRVRRVHAELQENHECEHPGRFERLFGNGRRSFQCEMCDIRHRKYILQCRHCYVNVCEDCRRNRI